MCGRIFQTLPLLRLLQIARTTKVSNQSMHSSSYNVCPTTHIPVIKSNLLYRVQKSQKKEEQVNQQNLNQEERQVSFMKWGYHGKQNFIINGRIQELTLKRTFLNFIQNRCVVIMEGYYQWNSKKEPYCFKSKDSDHFLVAALYTDQGEIIILTKDATLELSAIHHRMPVMLSHQEVTLWLDPKNTKDINNIIQKCLLKKDKQLWKNVGFAKLGPHVNSIKQKSQKCLMTIQQYKKQLDKTGLMRFWKKPPAVDIVLKQGQISELKSKPNFQQKPQKIQKRNNLQINELKSSEIIKQKVQIDNIPNEVVSESQQKHSI